MNQLVVANLVHRPVRSLISVFAVAIEVVMMLTIVALMLGQLSGQKRMNNGIGADLMVRPSNAMLFNGVSGAPLSTRLGPVLQAVPHVAVVSPVMHDLSMGDGLEVLWGIDYPSYSRLSPFVFLSGGPIRDPYDVMVDDVFASSGGGHRVGESIKIHDHMFRICGVFQHGKGGRKLVDIATLSQLKEGFPDRASAFYIKTDSPSNDQLVMNEIRSTRGMDKYQLMTMEEWFSLLTPDHVPALTTVIDVVIGIAVIIGFLVIFQAMYTSVLERTREIGILKSMGASRLTVVGVVLRETSLLAIAGVVFGIAASYGVKAFLNHRFPTLYLDMSLAWIVRGSAIAFVGSILGALYPAWMAARRDPIDALAYE